MPSDAYVRFVTSFELDFDRWHDGEGFDVGALAEIDRNERGDIVHLLAQRDATWREIQALEAIDIPPAFMAIKRALRDSEVIDTRLAAVAALDRLGKLDQPADELLAREIVNLSDLGNGCTRALLMAEAHPTDRVKQALLAASHQPTECAMHCAGVLCYLTGAGKEPFDWDLRPLLLRLGPKEPPDDREAAFRELCDLVKMQPISATP